MLVLLGVLLFLHESGMSG